MTPDDLRQIWQERSASGPGGSRGGCLAEESFAALLTGDMDSRARTEAGSHIAACQSCAEEFRALRSLGALFGERRPRTPGRVPLGLALAAALLLAAGLSVALLRYRAAMARSSAEIETTLKRLCDELGEKPRTVYLQIRAAVTGSRVSPGLYESLELLGKDTSLERIAAARRSGRARACRHPRWPRAWHGRGRWEPES